MLSSMKDIVGFLCRPQLLMVVVLFWVFAQINAVSAAGNPVLDQAYVGFLGDVRTIAREPDEEILLTVKGRTFPALVPKGLSVGKLAVLPSLGVGTKYNDNLFATNTNKVSDVAAVVTPRISAQTLKRKTFFGFDLGGEITRYKDNEDENTENFAAQTGGYFELLHNLRLPWSASYVRTHQDRTNNLSRVFTRKPLEISTARVEGGVSYKPNRFGLLVLGRSARTTYGDGVSLQDPTLRIIRSDSDFITNEIEIEGAYDFHTNHTAIVKTRLGATEYDSGIFNPATRAFTDRFRDSKNMSVSGNVVSNYKGLLFSDIEVGYQALDFKDSTISDVENLVIDVDADLNITKLSTLGLRLNRSAIQDNELVEGVVRTQGSVSYDYEVLRKLILSGQLTYVNRDFEETNREDDLYNIGVSFLYRPSPYYNLSGEYIHSTQDSTLSGNEFDRNLFMLRLTGQY